MANKLFRIKWGERLGDPKCPYVIRWTFETKYFSIRLHKWLGPDDLRNLHDHPWNYIAMVIKGGYVEYLDEKQGEGSLYQMVRGRPAYRHARRKHAVYPTSIPTWSILLTGPEWREWGFWVKGKFRKRNKYFFEHNHHPCE